MGNTRSKSIVITGGAHGVGHATACLLSQPLSHLVLSIDGAELEYAVTKHVCAYAPRTGYAAANLWSPDEARDAVAKAAQFFGGNIDVLITKQASRVPILQPATEQWKICDSGRVANIYRHKSERTILDMSGRHYICEGSESKTWAGSHSELHHRQHLVGRVGQGEDIAEAIEYAMGAGFMSG